MPRPPGADNNNTLASKARISLRADIDKLMDNFLLSETVRYQEFARVWQALNFALIYAGLKDTKEKREFIVDAYELVSEYLQPPFDLQRRVCALYTLYGLYYTQTHHPRIKIRMSLEDWKETLALHDDLQEQGHLDALYIFHKMRLDKAFMFTATHSNMYYQGRAKKPEDFEKWAAKHQSFMASVLDEDLLQELEQVHTSYQAGKQTSNFQDDASMAIVKDSMSEYIMERISNIDVPREESDSEALSDSRTRASRLREIKKRSFASPTKASQARRSRGLTTDDSGTDDPLYNPIISRSKRKGKRKAGRSTPGRPRKTDSDTSLSSPSKKRKRGSPGSPKDQKVVKQKAHPKKSVKKSTSDETEQSPNGAEVPAAESDSKSKAKKSTKKKKTTPKPPKNASDNKAKSSPSKAAKSGKKDKSKKKLFTDQVNDSVETPSSSKEKGGGPKKKSKKVKGRPVRSGGSKKPSTDSKKHVKVKVETPSKESLSVEGSPRKRPRKSATPKRLTRSQDRM